MWLHIRCERIFRCVTLSHLTKLRNPDVGVIYFTHLDIFIRSLEGITLTKEINWNGPIKIVIGTKHHIIILFLMS